MTVGDEAEVRELIALARREDLGTGDVTAALLAQGHERCRFSLVARQPGVLCGRQIVPGVLAAYDESIEIAWTEGAVDGTAWAGSPTTLATIVGPVHSVLAAERVLLNFLQRLCGIATITKAYVEAVAGTGAVILDTRKTTPGWRALEKYAVRCGGGNNHRRGLFDAVLIKDNHLAGTATAHLGRTVLDMLDRMAALGTKPAFVEVEAESLEQVEQLLQVVGVDRILLDNFSLEGLRAAVALRGERGLAGRVSLEASGGITLDTVGAVGATGVDFISVGAITHSAVACDLSLERV